MNKVLIVEDSALVAKVVMHIARQELEFDVLLATTFAEAKSFYEQYKDSIFAAIIDLNLPDAAEGEVVDYTLERKLPTVVLTGSVDSDIRAKLLKKGVVDYVNKEGRYSYQYAVRAINRLRKNQGIKVLVVEDSKVMRKQICRLLAIHQFQVLEAEDGIDAIKVFLQNPDIKLLITDYNMPNMDGFELVKNLRHKHEKLDLIIIGLSAEGEGTLSAKFIKSGANDFLTKPFNAEEFYCRINHSIESLELVEKIRDAAKRDYLTNLYSRRHFFECGDDMWAEAQRKGSPLAMGIINFDNFKALNEQYGNVFADKVIKSLAHVLEKSLSRFLVARSGGKEFYVLLPGLDNAKAVALLDGVRVLISRESFYHDNQEVFITASIGVSNLPGDRLQDQIASAEAYLARAKQAGKNLVLGDDDEDDDSEEEARQA